MAPQLPALVTVNWPLSEAVRVFYGRPFVWTLSGFTPVGRAELPTAAARCRTPLTLKLQPHDYWRRHFSVRSAHPIPSAPLPVPYLSAHF